MRLIVVHDGIQQVIFERAPIFSLIDEHRQVVILAVIGPL